MSFILDALKKSDKKRQDGKGPSLVTSHKIEADSRQSRPLWVLLLVLLLAVNAAVLLWVFGPWSQPEQSSLLHAASATSVEKKSPEEPVTLLAAKVSPSSGASEPLPELIDESPQAVTEAVPEAQSFAETVAESVTQNDSAMLQESTAPVDAAIAAEPQAAADSVAEQQAPRIYAVSDLPPAVRRDIPKMHMGMHAYYQDAKQRLISINNKLLREGRRLDGKYLLEEITVDGAIFSYAGYRFQVLFKSSRL